MISVTEVIICPLCCAEIHRHVGGRVETRIRLPYDMPNTGDVAAMLAEMARREREEELLAAERSCVAHYQALHPLRLALWRRLGWAFLMRWPNRYSFDRLYPVGRQEFDNPLQFMDSQR